MYPRRRLRIQRCLLGYMFALFVYEFGLLQIYVMYVLHVVYVLHVNTFTCNTYTCNTYICITCYVCITRECTREGVFEFEDAFSGPPATMNHVKIFKVRPRREAIFYWYTANTNHFHLTDSVRWK